MRPSAASWNLQTFQLAKDRPVPGRNRPLGPRSEHEDVPRRTGGRLAAGWNMPCYELGLGGPRKPRKRVLARRLEHPM